MVIAYGFGVAVGISEAGGDGVAVGVNVEAGDVGGQGCHHRAQHRGIINGENALEKDQLQDDQGGCGDKFHCVPNQ